MNKMNKENNIEMSTLDTRLPKHYKGFDIDVLIQKTHDDEVLTKEEDHAYCEAFDIFYRKHLEENQKKWEKWKKEHPGEYRTYRHPYKRSTNGE